MKQLIGRNQGAFSGQSFTVSNDSINWAYLAVLSVTSQGQLFSTNEDGNQFLLLKSLQSCYLQVNPTLTNGNQQSPLPTKKRLTKKNSAQSMDTQSSHDEPPIIFIKTYDNEKLYIKVSSKSNFDNLLGCLVTWQSMKPQGMGKKWYSENKVDKSTITDEPHELLVCRFKIYGPIPSKQKNLNIVPGPKAPSYHPKVDSQGDLSSLDISAGQHSGGSTQNESINEGWFYTMGVLKSNGSLNFITELDGTLLYAVDVKSIMSSEIREMHHSIFENSNILFIGQIKELRFNNEIKTTTPVVSEQALNPFLTREGKSVPSNSRILIEFPLHIDMEDWLVGLNYFAKREYIGCFSPRSRLLKTANEESPSLTDYTKDSLRVSKKVSIDIIEANFNSVKPEDKSSKIYAEVVMWGLPWSRTAPVNNVQSPFWKEEFSTDLPISTQMIHVLIKKCTSPDNSHSQADKLIGTVYLTPDILTKHLDKSTTMMTGSAFGNVMSVGSAAGQIGGQQGNNDIVRLSIYDSANLPIGKLLLNVNLKEYHILPPEKFKTLENMLMNSPMKDLIKFCNEHVPTSDFESVSMMLLDIFQSLEIEDKWFKSLMEVELVNVDNMTRKTYVSNKRNSEQPGTSSTSNNNVINTLFRGSSIFSKSLEKYNLRIGQEYLEKVFGDFFSKISEEKRSCEVDPRHVRVQEKAARKGKSSEDSDLDSDSDDYDSDEERETEERVKVMVEENYQNLYNYAEEIWNKIYITSNDLPQQIKLQLKNFRTKVELACDPEDKTTALNCLSAFIFLRFFCPAILNPKLFFLTKNHQEGNTQRTLTLIAKILLNLANRQEFSPHKEPHLIRMNDFLTKHQPEVYEYFDKITGRKNDFNEKILDLSHDVKRFDLGLSGESTSSELPTTPYLIDKYLRLTELIHLLDYNKVRASRQYGSNGGNFTSDSSITTTASNNITGNHRRDSSRESETDLWINDERNVYQIGSLEFEKSEFLDLAGDNETEGFIKSLCRSNEQIFSFITSNITLKDLQKQSTNLMGKINTIENFLENPEFPSNIENPTLWNLLREEIASKCFLDTARNSIVLIEKDIIVSSNYKKLRENAMSSLKLKFQPGSPGDHTSSQKAFGQDTTMSSSFSAGSLSSVMKTNTKNPFKKWLRKV